MKSKCLLVVFLYFFAFANLHANDAVKEGREVRPKSFVEVEQAVAAGEGKKAVKLAEEITVEYPESSEGFFLLADAYGVRIDEVNKLRKIGFAKKMLKAYQRSYELDPRNASAVVGLYEYYRQAPAIVGGDKMKAQELLPVVMEVDPAHGAFRQGMIAWKEKQWDVALNHLQQAAELDPENRTVQYLIGKLSAVSGLYLETGITVLTEYLKTPLLETDNSPSHDGAWWRLGLIYEHQNNLSKSVECFEHALALESDIEPRIKKDLARVKKLLESSIP